MTRTCDHCDAVISFGTTRCNTETCYLGEIGRLRQKLAASERELHQAEILARESRALLQRLAKYVREDNATTPGTTRLARLTEQVADYLQRTHDPRSILGEK